MSLESQIAKQVRKQLKLEKLATDLSGAGKYIFENNTKGDLYLPRPTESGRKVVRKGERFLGDSYYFGMLKTNMLKLVEEVQSPQQQLLTEQPPTVTGDGTVEYVQEIPEQPCNEGHGVKKPDVLISESPVDGIKILR